MTPDFFPWSRGGVGGGLWPSSSPDADADADGSAAAVTPEKNSPRWSPPEACDDATVEISLAPSSVRWADGEKGTGSMGGRRRRRRRRRKGGRRPSSSSDDGCSATVGTSRSNTPSPDALPDAFPDHNCTQTSRFSPFPDAGTQTSLFSGSHLLGARYAGVNDEVALADSMSLAKPPGMAEGKSRLDHSYWDGSCAGTYATRGGARSRVTMDSKAEDDGDSVGATNSLVASDEDVGEVDAANGGAEEEGGEVDAPPAAEDCPDPADSRASARAAVEASVPSCDADEEELRRELADLSGEACEWAKCGANVLGYLVAPMGSIFRYGGGNDDDDGGTRGHGSFGACRGKVIACGDGNGFGICCGNGSGNDDDNDADRGNGRGNGRSNGNGTYGRGDDAAAERADGPGPRVAVDPAAIDARNRGKSGPRAFDERRPARGGLEATDPSAGLPPLLDDPRRPLRAGRPSSACDASSSSSTCSSSFLLREPLYLDRPDEPAGALTSGGRIGISPAVDPRAKKLKLGGFFPEDSLNSRSECTEDDEEDDGLGDLDDIGRIESSDGVKALSRIFSSSALLFASERPSAPSFQFLEGLDDVSEPSELSCVHREDVGLVPDVASAKAATDSDYSFAPRAWAPKKGGARKRTYGAGTGTGTGERGEAPTVDGARRGPTRTRAADDGIGTRTGKETGVREAREVRPAAATGRRRTLPARKAAAATRARSVRAATPRASSAPEAAALKVVAPEVTALEAAAAEDPPAAAAQAAVGKLGRREALRAKRRRGRRAAAATAEDGASDVAKAAPAAGTRTAAIGARIAASSSTATPVVAKAAPAAKRAATRTTAAGALAAAVAARTSARPSGASKKVAPAAATSATPAAAKVGTPRTMAGARAAAAAWSSGVEKVPEASGSAARKAAGRAARAAAAVAPARAAPEARTTTPLAAGPRATAAAGADPPGSEGSAAPTGKRWQEARWAKHRRRRNEPGEASAPLLSRRNAATTNGGHVANKSELTKHRRRWDRSVPVDVARPLGRNDANAEAANSAVHPKREEGRGFAPPSGGTKLSDCRRRRDGASSNATGAGGALLGADGNDSKPASLVGPPKRDGGRDAVVCEASAAPEKKHAFATRRRRFEPSRVTASSEGKQGTTGASAKAAVGDSDLSRTRYQSKPDAATPSKGTDDGAGPTNDSPETTQSGGERVLADWNGRKRERRARRRGKELGTTTSSVATTTTTTSSIATRPSPGSVRPTGGGWSRSVPEGKLRVR